MSRVFVAGGTGVIGRRAVDQLIAAGHDVTVNARDSDARNRIGQRGGHPVTIDLFDADAAAAAVEGHDAVVNVATAIPSGVRAARPSAWSLNDRLRTEAASNLAAAAIAVGCRRYIGESITFPYVDSGDAWVDETADRTYFSGNETCVDTERAAATVTDAGGAGVTLRFAMFVASDSAHTELFEKVARCGISPLPGAADGYISFIDGDDAAAAVVAALDAPAGTYNIAESEPTTRAAHAIALADAVGRKRLRSLPSWMVRLGGDAVDSLARSQRISSRKFAEATGWQPGRRIIDDWFV